MHVYIVNELIETINCYCKQHDYINCSSEINFKQPFLVQQNTKKSLLKIKCTSTLCKLIYTYRKRTANIYPAFELG